MINRKLKLNLRGVLPVWKRCFNPRRYWEIEVTLSNECQYYSPFPNGPNPKIRSHKFIVARSCIHMDNIFHNTVEYN